MEWVAMGPHHPTSIVFHPHLSQKITRISWTSGAHGSCLDQSWSRDGGRTLPRDGAWHQIKKQISKPLRTGGQGNRCSRRTGPCLVGIAVLMVQETRMHRKELRLPLADDSNLCLLSTETLEEKKPSLFASLLKESEELTMQPAIWSLRTAQRPTVGFAIPVDLMSPTQSGIWQQKQHSELVHTTHLSLFSRFHIETIL